MKTVLALFGMALIGSEIPLQADEAGMLTPELVAQLMEGYEIEGADLARHNAVTNASLSTLALNREVVKGDDGHFSHRIKSKGITNQKKSGRCWMFAGLNVVRPAVIREHEMEGFEFSMAYLQFWDKLEKSNMYLEAVIELRDAGHLDREWEVVNQWALGDGGWWNYVTGLVQKYGVVPADVMPETHGSENTGVMNHVLERLVRSRAAKMMTIYEKGGDVTAMRAEKEKALKDVYRFLAINLGEPPKEFEWRYKIKKAGKDDEEEEGEESKDEVKVEDERLTPMVRYTPKAFYDKFVGTPLDEFVCLYHDANEEIGGHYRFKRSRNMVGEETMHFVNIEIDTMKEIAVASVLGNEPLWFAVNMSIDQSNQHGLMEDGLFDYETLFDVDLTLSKADRAKFRAGTSNHAMVLMGVDLVDGKPRKWLVENSWGDDKGEKGTWTLYDKWFDEHVYTIIVHKRHVPEGILAGFEKEAKELPAWYPGAMGIE